MEDSSPGAVSHCSQRNGFSFQIELGKEKATFRQVANRENHTEHFI